MATRRSAEVIVAEEIIVNKVQKGRRRLAKGTEQESARAVQVEDKLGRRPS
jgi:hypothetical protein